MLFILLQVAPFITKYEIHEYINTIQSPHTEDNYKLSIHMKITD